MGAGGRDAMVVEERARDFLGSLDARDARDDQTSAINQQGVFDASIPNLSLSSYPRPCDSRATRYALYPTPNYYM